MRIPILVLLSVLVPLAACRSTPPPEQALELRIYDVPKGTAGALATTLKDVTWLGEVAGGATGGRNIGRAVVTPDGRLAVLATPAVQAGAQTLVDEVTTHPPQAEQSVELQYFIVYGKPAPSPQPLPPGGAEIKPALDEIVRAQGPQTFTIAQRVRLTSLHDEEGRLDDVDAKLEIRQQPVQTNDGVYAKLLIRWKADKIETKVRLAPDRLVVLGSTGEKPTDGGGGTLYYVVRIAPRADGQRP
jgi:hypothetical protein